MLSALRVSVASRGACVVLSQHSSASQFAQRPEQVHPNRRRAHAGRRARSRAGVRSSSWQSVNTSRCRSGRAATACETCCHRSRRQQPPLASTARSPAPVRPAARRRFVRRLAHRAAAAGRAFSRSSARVDQNPREPRLERQVLAVLLDVQEHLDERVLHRFVGVGRVRADTETRSGAPAAGAAPPARRSARAPRPARRLRPAP